jgi:S-adenosyl methyltransferase
VDGNGATVHGIYDYWLGGSSHRPDDRELGEAIAARFPLVPVHVRAAHDFTLRATRWAALRGISRFIRAGSVTYLPGRNVHDAARQVNPAAEVAYVNRDAGAHALMAALTSSGRLTSAVHATVGRPEELLSSPPIGKWTGEGEPVCMIIWMSLTFASPEVAPDLVAAYAESLTPGSVVALTVALADDSPEADELVAVYTPAKIRRHSAGDVAGWLTGAGLKIVDPGVADVRLFGRPPWAAGELEARPPGTIAGGLAVKP